MSRQYGTVKAGKLKRPANHIRDKLGSEEELRLLGRSYLKRPIHAIICRPDFEVEDGNRRLAGVLLEAGPEAEVPVCITDEAMTDVAKLEIQMESAIHTRGLSAFEQFKGASQWLELNPGATAEQLGQRIGRTGSMMTRILSLARCVPEVQEQAAAGQIGVADWYEFSKCPEEQQRELLKAKQSGEVTSRAQLVRSREQLGRAGRKSGNGSAPTVRVNRIKCAVQGSRATVVVSGEGLTLESMIEVMQELLREAKKASERGLDAKTFERVCRDLAKKV
jgi:ParB-like chromosome segregation protein Spo0J